MKRTTHHCDNCGAQVSYWGGDGDNQIAGFTSDEVTKYKVRMHDPTTCGSSHSPVQTLQLPTNICSKSCMQEYIQSWLDALPEIHDTRKVIKKESS